MNKQYLMNKPIEVQYSFKKEKAGERHGTAAERLLAAQARKNMALPISARPPAAPAALLGQFGVRPPMPFAPLPGGYQGQFAGALAQPAPAPPIGFQGMAQGMVPGMGQGMGPPGGMQMGVPPPPAGFNAMYMQQPPPPQGFGMQGMMQQKQQ
jgi:splicing factor 3B subunit 4